MARGKETCRILKEIRRQIAEANDIEFITSECRYKGDCLGTCPKCEAEVRYLEQQLRARSLAGKAVALAGISVTAFAMLMPISAETQIQPDSKDFLKGSVPVLADTIKVKGVVLSGDTLPDGSISKEPMPGATVQNRRTSLGAITDVDGKFGLPVCIGDTLEVCFVGYDTQAIVVTEDLRSIEVVLRPNPNELTGEVVLVGAIGNPSTPLRGIVVDEKCKPLSDVEISIVGRDESGDLDYENLDWQTDTDENGNFDCVAYLDTVVYLSKNGFQPKAIRIRKNKDYSNLRIKLKRIKVK